MKTDCFHQIGTEFDGEMQLEIYIGLCHYFHFYVIIWRRSKNVSFLAMIFSSLHLLDNAIEVGFITTINTSYKNN